MAMSVVKPKVWHCISERNREFFNVECHYCTDIIRYGGCMWQVHDSDPVYLWLCGPTSFPRGTLQVPITYKKVLEKCLNVYSKVMYLYLSAVDLVVPTLTVVAEVIIQMMMGAGLLATRRRGQEEVGGARREEGTSLNSLNLFLLSIPLTTCLTCLTRKWALLNRFDQTSKH